MNITDAFEEADRAALTDRDDAAALLASERRVVAARAAYRIGTPGAARALTEAVHERERIRAALHLDLIR